MAAGRYRPYGINPTATSIPYFSEADELLLAQAIFERGNTETVGEIARELSRLHGHTSQEWSQFYVDNTVRIRDLISTNFPSGPPQCAPTSEIPSRATTPSIEQRPSEDGVEQNDSQSDGSQVASVSANSKAPQSRMPPPLPTFSKSPEPPTKVVQDNRGNKFTEDDKRYAEHFFRYRLRNKPYPSTNRIFTEIALRVTHHSDKSWKKYWTRNRIFFDSIRHEVEMEVQRNSSSADYARPPSKAPPTDSNDAAEAKKLAKFIRGQTQWYLSRDRTKLWKEYALKESVALARSNEPTRTAGVWEKFYDTHQKEVDARVRAMARKKKKKLNNRLMKNAAPDEQIYTKSSENSVAY
ncbi:hypothetical protein BU17DRAFT_66957 [Hysterangium stoloniferum]|nr:hypothetical protein BU17DRAFT_66957 [Hysterangium stoloniferum]